MKFITFVLVDIILLKIDDQTFENGYWMRQRRYQFLTGHDESYTEPILMIDDLIFDQNFKYCFAIFGQFLGGPNSYALQCVSFLNLMLISSEFQYQKANKTLFGD